MRGFVQHIFPLLIYSPCQFWSFNIWPKALEENDQNTAVKISETEVKWHFNPIESVRNTSDFSTTPVAFLTDINQLCQRIYFHAWLLLLELQMGYHDMAFLPSRDSFYTTFLKKYLTSQGLGTTTFPKTVVGGKQGYSPCKVISLHKASILCQSNFMEIIGLLQRWGEIWPSSVVGILRKKWKCVNFKCYSSEDLITLNTLHEVVPTWYSFHSWVDWSNADKVSCSMRNILMLGIEPSTFVSKIDILTTTPIVAGFKTVVSICQTHLLYISFIYIFHILWCIFIYIIYYLYIYIIHIS